MRPQITNSTYDDDTGILRLRLSTGEQFQVTNPGHAVRIRNRISHGKHLTDLQYSWLAKYRVEIGNKVVLRRKLAQLREELRSGQA